MTGHAAPAEWKALTVRRKTDLADMPQLELPPSEHFSIVALIRGACRIESRGEHGWRAATYVAGDVGITLPGRAVMLRWQLLAAQPKETVHLTLPMSAFDRFLAEESGPRISDLAQLDVLSAPDPVIAAMAAALIRASEAGQGEIHAESAAQYLVAHLLTPRAARTPEAQALSERQLGVVTEYMRANLGRRISLEDLAREVSLSRFHFLRLFAATTGKPPHQFLTEIRIEVARRQLETSDEPVGQVGRRSGFPSPSHFAATFNRHVGCSPTVYRRRVRSS